MVGKSDFLGMTFVYLIGVENGRFPEHGFKAPHASQDVFHLTSREFIPRMNFMDSLPLRHRQRSVRVPFSVRGDISSRRTYLPYQTTSFFSCSCLAGITSWRVSFSDYKDVSRLAGQLDSMTHFR